jgi:hypothetical protein
VAAWQAAHNESARHRRAMWGWSVSALQAVHAAAQPVVPRAAEQAASGLWSGRGGVGGAGGAAVGPARCATAEAPAGVGQLRTHTHAAHPRCSSLHGRACMRRCFVWMLVESVACGRHAGHP